MVMNVVVSPNKIREEKPVAKTRIVSFSEIDTYRQCGLKHDLAYKQRFSKPADEGSALSRGTLFHAVLEQHYLALRATQRGETFESNIDALLSLDDVENQSEQQSLVAWIYDGYVRHYGNDDDWEILEVEGSHTMWLPTERGTRSSFKLKAKIDLIVRSRRTGKIHVVDHKSAKDLTNERAYELDDQFGLYGLILRQEGIDVTTSIHNACRTFKLKDQSKQPLDERFKRTSLYRTDDELNTIAVEAYRSVKQAYSIPVGEAPRSPNSDSCRWKCQYLEDCLGARKQPPAGQDAYLKRSLGLHGFKQDWTRH